MIIPLLKETALLEDIRQARQVSDHFHLWWLGQSGFLVCWQGQFLLFDPYLSDSLTRKYADSAKPHVRMTERVIDPGQLDFVDLVTSSHNHTDHLDAETLKPLIAANLDMAVVVPSANRQFVAERLGVEEDWLHCLEVGEQFSHGRFTLHAVPAAHEQLDLDDEGRHPYLGYVASFGPWSIYHSGDTVPYEGMVDQLSPWNLDLAMLPINGRTATRDVPGNLWGREAVQLAREAGISMVIPCHYDMFTFNTETPDEFLREAAVTGQPVQVLQAGERFSSHQLP
ncbi:MAG: MBL fold metallo-hydrolase [Planctomycetota bacterium]|nr:MBL fold metallo-hydrolase [Planctomycetota bacterium]